METEFTPLFSLFGGILIGVSAMILLLMNGRIAGISGIVSSILPPVAGGSRFWEGVAFVAGLLIAVPTYKLVVGSMPSYAITSNPVLLAVAGALVGAGSVLGSGCTSGHGVCGLARLSQRSIVATASFMIVAAVVVFVSRHIFGS